MNVLFFEVYKQLRKGKRGEECPSDECPSGECSLNECL